MLNTEARFEHITDPFVVHLAQRTLTAPQVRALYATAPLHRARPIARTDPEHEKQYAMNLVYLVRHGERTTVATELSAEWTELLDDLLSEPFTGWLERGTGLALRRLPLDIGVYTHADGDFISVHKDKPTKAVTAILYLNENWPADAGGQYEARAGDDPDAEPVRRIPPRGGQFLAFPPTGTSWHSVSPVRAAADTIRLTVQLEFWHQGQQGRD